MPKSLIYTAIGDSLTYGTGAPDKMGFPNLVQEHCRTKAQKPIVLHNYGVVGATTAQILERVRTDAALRRTLSDADMATLTAGGNDLIQAALQMYVHGTAQSMKHPMRRFAAAYKTLLEEIVSVHRTKERNGRIIVVDCYNPFPQVWDAKLWINYVNRCIHRTAAEYKGTVLVARAYDAFLGKEDRVFADDGVHPNEEGHALLSEAVLRASCEI